MNSKIVRIFMAMMLAIPFVGVAQTGSAASTAPAAAAATAPPPAAAGPTKVGVVNIQDAILATNEGRREFEALGKKFEPKRTEIKTQTDEIDSLKKQLDSQGKTMTDDARASLVRQIESKQKALQRNQEDAQNDFVGQQNEIAQKILQKLGPVIAKYATDNGLGLIIDTSKPWPDGPVLWTGQSVDITPTVVELYNQQSGVPSAPSATRPVGSTRPAGGGTSRPATTPATKPQTTTPPKQ